MIRILTIFMLASLALPVAAGDLEKTLGRSSLEVRAVQLSAAMLVDEMNRERARHGLAPLRLDSRLSLAAEDRINDMFDKRYFDHVAPDGTPPFVWAGRRGYGYRAIAENLAVGYRTSSNLIEGWMGSAGHRKNILGKRFEEVGIAISAGSPTKQFGGPTVVALYGSR